MPRKAAGHSGLIFHGSAVVEGAQLTHQRTPQTLSVSGGHGEKVFRRDFCRERDRVGLIAADERDRDAGTYAGTSTAATGQFAQCVDDRRAQNGCND